MLRDYQSEIIDDFDRLVARGVWSLLVITPTGSDKTVIASLLVASVVAEVKCRKNGGRFVTLERWLGDYDALFLRRNHSNPPVVIAWRTWARILGGAPMTSGTICQVTTRFIAHHDGAELRVCTAFRFRNSRHQPRCVSRTVRCQAGDLKPAPKRGRK